MYVTYKIEKLESGGYMAYCTDFKPVVVRADTEKEVSEKLLSAAKLYLQIHPEISKSIRSAELEI